MSRLQVSITVPLTDDPTEAVLAAVGELGKSTSVDVRWEPDLLPPQRYPADHRGEPDFVRSPANQARWEQMLAGTDVSLGIPGDSPNGLRSLMAAAPNLRWVQGTAAGAGEQVAGAGLEPSQLQQVRVTSAAGLHGVPLAEFAVSGLLAMAKDHAVLRAASQAHEWRSRWPMGLLDGSRALVLGLGGIGVEVARLLAAFVVEVTALRRRPDRDDPHALPMGVARLVSLDELDEVLPQADSVVSTLPGTGTTRGLLDARRLALLPAHAVVVNVGRGSVVDSGALVAALDAGRLRGAVLDVTDTEPLPPSSPLWGRDDVLLSPHTAGLTLSEDRSITALFADNLTRFLTDRPLRNLVDPAQGY